MALILKNLPEYLLKIWRHGYEKQATPQLGFRGLVQGDFLATKEPDIAKVFATLSEPLFSPLELPSSAILIQTTLESFVEGAKTQIVITNIDEI